MNQNIFSTRNFSIEEAFEFFIKNGYLVIRDGLPSNLVDDVKNQFESFVAVTSTYFEPHKDYDGHFPRIVNLHTAFSPLIQLFTSNTFSLAIQDKFFGETSSIYTSLYYERGSSQPIHRDTPYFATKPEHKYLGVWVALEDADENNGCLEDMPGGHQLPELNLEEIALSLFESLDAIDPASQKLWDKYQEAVYKQGLAAKITPKKLSVKKGDTVIWHPQLPHGGGANFRH